MLPEVRTYVRQLIQLNRTIILLSEAEISYDNEFEELKADLRANKELHRLSVQLFEGLEQLAERGCIVKDLETGLLDFYSVFEGRPIFLCWKADEDAIEHWHETDQGFDDRKPILELVEKPAS